MFIDKLRASKARRYIAERAFFKFLNGLEQKN